ncbi:sensor histidine kinase [Luteibacter sp. E-22]|uniref:sensor histidine kinase n=1 Tax=Luteibacter sp. E-22 TaxID=3404050 RepID=UPI003CE84564
MNDDATGLIERAIATGDHEFRELADFAPVMIWRSGPDKLCDWFNKPWLEYTGRDMAAEVGNGWATGVHPDDLERCLETYVDAFDARKPFSMEYRLRRYDGQYRWLLDNGAPFHRGGAFAGYWGSCVDVSNHRDAERAQRIVINDLNHRMKNVLAVVQAMAMQSFTDDRPLDISMSAFGSRLRALARAHDLLLDPSRNDLTLHGVIQSAVAPHDPGKARITFEGPPLVLDPEAAVAMAMAIHELLTNAAKYGALSTPSGTVAIAWTYVETPEPGKARLEWKERGGPPVAAPMRRGFGTRFIERVLSGQSRGQAAIRFEQDGVRAVFEATAGLPWSPQPKKNAPG